MHLTAEQDGIYRRLIDFYMETKQPLPDSDNALSRAAGIDLEQWSKSASIIRPFFCLENDGKLHLKRCDIEIARQNGKKISHAKRGKIGAKVRWNKYNKNNGDNSNCHSIAIAEPMANHSRGDKRREESKKVNPPIPQADFHLPEGIPEQDWNDYRIMRQKIRKPMTRRAEEMAIARLLELKTEGHAPESVLRHSILNAYQGLFPPSKTFDKPQKRTFATQKNIIDDLDKSK